MTDHSLLSTKRVAELLNVAETTVKRWADEQTITCVRTPGGHRKFSAAEIVAFAERHHYPVTGLTPTEGTQPERNRLQLGVQTRDFTLLSRLFLDHALHGDRQTLHDVLIYVYTHHIPFASIVDQIIRPAMNVVGERWSNGELEVNQEHRASHAVLEALHRFGIQLHRKPRNGLTAVSSCVQGELHQIGLQSVVYGLETEGWDVHMLGADTPHASLVSYVERVQPGVVALSATILRKKQWAGGIASLREMVHRWNGIVLLGGSAAEGYTANDLGCDFVADSLEGALAFVRERFELKPGPKKSKHETTRGR